MALESSSSSSVKKAVVTVDLGFGDSGKGSMVDALVRHLNAKLVVRYCGGAQAGHNVVTDDGQHHCFAQLGAGSFVPDCLTLLGRKMVVNPLAMYLEVDHFLSKANTPIWNRIHVDGRCLVTTPYHRAMNRLREMQRGDDLHGSCGMGVGETVRLSQVLAAPLVAADLRDIELTHNKLKLIKKALLDELADFDLDVTDSMIQAELGTFTVPPMQLVPKYTDWSKKVSILDPAGVAELVDRHETIVFEGAHGLLIDENIGFHPHTTWNSLLPIHATDMLAEAEWRGQVTTLGLLRTYMTRHGAGPFPSENRIMTDSDPYNPANPWQGKMRFGYLDLPFLRYAIEAGGFVDGLAVSCMDQLRSKWTCVTEYGDRLLLKIGATSPSDHATREQLTQSLTKARPKLKVLEAPTAAKVIQIIEGELRAEVRAVSFGPKPRFKEFKRL